MADYRHNLTVWKRNNVTNKMEKKQLEVLTKIIWKILKTFNQSQKLIKTNFGSLYGINNKQCLQNIERLRLEYYFLSREAGKLKKLNEGCCIREVAWGKLHEGSCMSTLFPEMHVTADTRTGTNASKFITRMKS